MGSVDECGVLKKGVKRGQPWILTAPTLGGEELD